MQLPDQRSVSSPRAQDGWGSREGLHMGLRCEEALQGRRCSSPTLPQSLISIPLAWDAPPLGAAPPATRPPMAFLSLCLRLLSALVSPPSQQQPLFLNPLLPTPSLSASSCPATSGQPLPHSLSLPRPFRAGLLPHALGALSSQALSSAPIAFILTCRPEAQPHPWTTDLVQPLTEQPSSVSQEQGSDWISHLLPRKLCVSSSPHLCWWQHDSPQLSSKKPGKPLTQFSLPFPCNESPRPVNHPLLPLCLLGTCTAPTGPPKSSLSIGVNLLGFRAQA